MDVIKERAIALLLGIISKKDFEMILYEKVKTEDLVQNRLLFDLVNINYRNDEYQTEFLEVLQEFVNEEELLVYKICLYSNQIIEANDYEPIYRYFNKMFTLFEYDKDYALMWKFYSINSRIDLIGYNYEKEELVIADLKNLCSRVCNEFKSLSTVNEKTDLLANGFKENSLLNIKNNRPEKQGSTFKKWYQFWK